ncbi:hypothetical protein SCP_1001760 [Sparassis crispa]|uniref:Nudix hydrolase domain-containing protein n=1 Tax=Sparassis crispa TaxID=139825 RepID=A0A401GXM0_9APHY|nr:hypothetical protein SCP_1001760 [Sparassis crispa]GBE86932.1 hypothetical protein SCP_1001760 [Sparassis crispa]
MWHSSDFLLGVGMVILQPSTDKVVLVYETERKYWFLPKGRKDIGESLEQAALREAYEESGYRVEFLPLFTPTNAPPAPNSDHDFFDFPNTEPFYVSALAWNKRTRRQGRPPRTGDNGGEYLTFWYVGQIPDGAVPELNTGMPDEKNYKSYLLTFDEALHVTQGNAAPMTRKLVCAAYTLLTSTRRTMVAMEQATLLDHLNVDNDHSSGEDRREDRRA